MERIALPLSYLIKMTRITNNTITTATAPIPPAIGPIGVGGSDKDGGTTIKMKINVHFHCFKTILH